MATHHKPSVFISLIVLVFALVISGCAEEDNFIEGSLTSQYAMGFDSVGVYHYYSSSYMLIEYVTSSGEKPLIVTLRPAPDGPGRYTHGEDGYSISVANSLTSHNALPDLQSGSIDVDAFTPHDPPNDVDANGTNAQGVIHGVFQQEGTGDSFTLEAGFKASLLVR